MSSIWTEDLNNLINFQHQSFPEFDKPAESKDDIKLYSFICRFIKLLTHWSNPSELKQSVPKTRIPKLWKRAQQTSPKENNRTLLSFLSLVWKFEIKFIHSGLIAGLSIPYHTEKEQKIVRFFCSPYFMTWNSADKTPKKCLYECKEFQNVEAFCVCFHQMRKTTQATAKPVNLKGVDT